MRKWYQRSRKRDGWIERKRRFQRMFAASDKRREGAVAQETQELPVEKLATE